MALGIATTLRNNIVADYKTRIDTAAGASALLTLYSGTRPVLGGTAPAALVTFTCGATFFGVQSGNVLPILTPGAQSGSGSAGAAPGTLATWARLNSAVGQLILECNVSQTGATSGPDGGSVDLTMNDPHIVASATITPSTNLTFTVLP